MDQAEKFRRPVITFMGLPGAYPGVGAERAWFGYGVLTEDVDADSSVLR